MPACREPQASWSVALLDAQAALAVKEAPVGLGLRFCVPGPQPKRLTGQNIAQWVGAWPLGSDCLCLSP